MPQPRNTTAKSTGAARSGTKRASSTTKRASTSSASAKRSTTSAKRSTTSAKRSTGSASSARASTSARTQAKRTPAGAADLRLDAVAERVRKLNERIIEAGRDAGETTLTTYEKALKAIATSLDRGAAASDVEWVSHLLSTQAKFIRDVTSSWTSAARGMMK